MGMNDNFTVWIAWEKGDKPAAFGGVYREPAEAVDYAEGMLTTPRAKAGESYAEIRFNGDQEPHTVLFLLEKTEGDLPVYGVWNTESALWPIFYLDTNNASMLDGNPWDDEGDSDEWEEGEGEHKADEDSDKMDLGGQDDEPDTESEGDSEEFPDDENEDDDGEADEEDEDDDDEREGENEDAEDREDEAEMPRLNIFAKMRGPKGWRKRAEAEELQERNVFGLKVGILDPEAEKPGQQERNVVAHVEFIESDETRDHGVLKLRLPEGITPADFTQSKSGVITVRVPYATPE